MGSHAKLWIFALVVSIVCQNFQTSSGLTMNPDGGYNVILAIKHDEPKPTNVDAYINNIKAAFGSLSSKMWIATRENFYIASLEIILPQSWEVTTSGLRTVSYSTADIRVSSAITFPYVENANLCGLPGDFIELPKGFFDNANTGALGENWKVLLVEWARYRWGAYEEHGIPGDKRFPYFTKDFDAEGVDPKWVPNGCTNAQDNKLVGVYRTIAGAPCDPTSDDELSLECRFYPDKNANTEVTSSLMHFHFMESVTHFCDATTHQKYVPTKQNLYCDNKSVMETIESSPDFKAVTQKAEYVPNLKTTLSTAASKPALYVLLDRSLPDNEDAGVVAQVTPILGNFFANLDTAVHNELIVGVGQFPSVETGPFLKPLVGMDFLSANRDHVIDAIGNYEIVNNGNYDFGLALQQAAAAIRANSPSEGGNILLLKTGGARNDSTFSSEKELELSLRSENIRLYTIEITDVAKSRQNLANIAGATQGDAIALDSATASAQISIAVETFLETTLLGGYATVPTHDRLARITSSRAVAPNIDYSVPVLAGVQNLTFILTTTGALNPSQVIAGIVTPQVTIRAPFTQGKEFGSVLNLYTGSLDTSTWNLNEVTFTYQGTTPGHLTVLSDGAILPVDLTVTVQTSAADNNVDLGNIANPDAPFVITAVVKQGNRPVTGANVVATIQLADQISNEVVLLDSAYGLDNPAGDGSYAEIALFPRNGDYSITVTVTKGEASTSQTVAYRSPRLLPPDQSFETVESVPFPTGATKVASLPSAIHVTNTENFIPSIQTIRDLSVEENEDEVTFTMTIPRIFSLTGIGAGPNVFRFYTTENQELLIDLDPSNVPEGVQESFSKTGETVPGTNIPVIYTKSSSAVPVYFAVIAFSGQTASRVSNVVMLTPSEVPDQSTTDPESTGDTEEPGSSTSGPSPPVDPPGPEPEPEESKPWIKSTGGIVTIVVIVLVCFAAAGVGYWYTNKRRQARISKFATDQPA